MYVAIIDLVQYDCPVIGLTEITEGVKATVLGVNNAYINNGVEKLYLHLEGDSFREVYNCIENIDRKRLAIDYRIIYRKNNKAGIYMVIKKTDAMEKSLEYNAIPAAPWVSVDGVERWTLGFLRKNELNEYISRVKDKNYVKRARVIKVQEDTMAIVSLSFFSILEFLEEINKLTKTQLRMLEKAFIEGYYEWPRKKNLMDLSKDMGVSRVAVTKLLRRAEYKVVKSILKLTNEISRDKKGYGKGDRVFTVSKK